MGSFYGRGGNTGGGGEGTSNYNELFNKPKINGVVLSGNKTLPQLGIPTKTSEIINDKGYVTASILPAGGTTGQILAKHSNSDYDLEWTDQETGGGDVLSVNGKTGDVVLKTSDLQNDSGYITKSVDNLTNYTTTSDMNTALSGKVSNSSVGIAGGVAELDNTGKVPSTQLPSYVDDVVDGYYNETDGKFYEESTYTTEILGEADKIYISVDTNIQYRWTGSAFSALGGALILGETSSTAYRGDRGKEAYDISQTVGDITNLNTTDKSSVVNAVNELADRALTHTVKDSGTAETQRTGLNFIDHDITDDSTNDNTDVAPHELTPAEWADIMPVLPGINSGGVIFDERGTEYVVGQYILANGTRKPIYQKTFSGAFGTPSTANKRKYWDAALSISNLDKVLDVKGCTNYVISSNSYALQYGSTLMNTDATIQAAMTGLTQSTGFVFRFFGDNSAGFSNLTYNATVQYTKSTDTPV